MKDRQIRVAVEVAVERRAGIGRVAGDIKEGDTVRFRYDGGKVQWETMPAREAAPAVAGKQKPQSAA